MSPSQYDGAEEHDREVADLGGLAQRGGLEQLVERAEPAGEDDERARVAHEHHLAREEVVEVEAEVDVGVLELLVRQLDVEPDRRHARVARAAVAGLHDPRAAAGDDREAGAAERGGRLARLRVHRVVARRARGAEDRDRLADVREALEAGPQLLVDPPQPRRVVELGDDRRGVGLEQLLVGRGRRPRVRAPELLLVGLRPVQVGAGKRVLVRGLVHASRLVGPDSWTIARHGIAP